MSDTVLELEEDEKMVYECSEVIKTAGCSADNFDELIAILEGQVEWLKSMKAAGITMEPPAHDGWFHFTTEDVEVAKRFGMLPWDYYDNPDRYPEFTLLMMDPNDSPSN